MTVHTLIDARGRPISERAPTPAKPIKPTADRQREIIDVNAHNITITALALALAKHFIVGADQAAADSFIAYLTDQSRRIAAQTGVPAIAAAAEEKTSQLAGMLMAKRAEAKRDGEQR